MIIQGAEDPLEAVLMGLGVDTGFWVRRSRLLDEFNDLSAQGVHCRFWPSRESGCQLEGDWESEIVNPELPEPLAEVLRATESTELSSLERFVALPIVVADMLSREGHGEQALDCYWAALQNAPNPWIQSELGYLLLERAGVQSLPACAADLDKAEVIGKVGGAVPFLHRSRMLDIALQAFGRAWAYTYTQVHLIECDPDLAFDLLTLDGLRVTFLELGHTPGLEAVRDWFWDLVDHVFGPTELDYARDLGLLGSFREMGILVPQGPAGTVEPDVLQEYDERCARRFGPHWEALPQWARVLVSEGECAFERLPRSMRDWGSVALNYFKALEWVLRQRLGAKIDDDADLANALHALLPDRSGLFRRLQIGDFARLLERVRENQLALWLFRPFLERNAPGQEGFYLGELPEKLRELSRDRGPSAHPDPPRRVGRQEVKHLRRTLMPDLDGKREGLLARLAVFGQR